MDSKEYMEESEDDLLEETPKKMSYTRKKDLLSSTIFKRSCRPFPPPSVLQLKKMLVWARIPDLPTEQRRFSMEGWESSWRKLLVPIIMVLGKTLRIEYGGIINLQPIASVSYPSLVYNHKQRAREATTCIVGRTTPKGCKTRKCNPRGGNWQRNGATGGEKVDLFPEANVINLRLQGSDHSERNDIVVQFDYTSSGNRISSAAGLVISKIKLISLEPGNGNQTWFWQDIIHPELRRFVHLTNVSISDGQDNFPASFYARNGSWDLIIQAEILAILARLKVSRDSHIKKLLVESDLKVVVEIITGNYHVEHHCYELLSSSLKSRCRLLSSAIVSNVVSVVFSLLLSHLGQILLILVSNVPF
ncbi:hypothetical protein RJT34_27657 [Clitoria ternatea]|uniref:RNase H type-1 domain-containing protein n=1 Tax=Clitoria ternatea TaxID=43366 RepID=A0AAN9I8M0_CLITE